MNFVHVKWTYSGARYPYELTSLVVVVSLSFVLPTSFAYQQICEIFRNNLMPSKFIITLALKEESSKMLLVLIA